MRRGERGETGRLARAGWCLTALALIFVLGLPGEAVAGEQREVPDYDGREDQTTAGDALLWVPRVLFFPVYLVTEYVIRWPLGKLATWAEQSGLLGATSDVGIFPTIFIEFAMRPSIGFYFFINNFPTPHDGFRIHFAWGGSEWWYLTVRQYFRGPPSDESEAAEVGLRESPSELSTHFEYKQRPDPLYFGLGPRSSYTNFTRYWRRVLGGHVDGMVRLGTRDALEMVVGVEQNQLRNRGSIDRSEGELRIGDAFDLSDPMDVPGFEDYLLTYLDVNLVLDTRPLLRYPRTGARLELLNRFGIDAKATGRRFLSTAGELSGFVDLSGVGHSIGLRQYVRLVTDLGDLAVPFTELAILGGSELMRGFPTGRFHGPSATITTFQYVYPIWLFVDGFAFFEVGNVFGEAFKGFSFGQLVAAFGMGVRAQWDPDFQIDLMWGWGTDRFEESRWGVDAFRFAVGVSQGF